MIFDFLQELDRDAGAVKIDMFASFFKAALKEMFEPLSESGCIPKRSMTIFLYNLLGLAMAHCFLQNGPPFQGLTSWCYNFLIKEDEDIICSQLNATDILLNSGTSILKLFRQKLENASSNEELESMIVKKVLHSSKYWICRNGALTTLPLWKIEIS